MEKEPDGYPFVNLVDFIVDLDNDLVFLRDDERQRYLLYQSEDNDRSRSRMTSRKYDGSDFILKDYTDKD